MGNKLTKLAIMTSSMALVAAFATPASALTLNTDGVVGAFTNATLDLTNPPNGNTPEEEAALAEFLLDMATNSTSAPGCNISNPAVACFATGDNNYSGNLGTFTKFDNNSTNVAGWTWVLGKYDGPNAGYILYYMPDFGGTTIPSIPADIWGNTSSTGLGLSHTIRWGQTSVPDGGMTLLFLGAAMGGLGLIRRRFNG